VGWASVLSRESATFYVYVVVAKSWSPTWLTVGDQTGRIIGAPPGSVVMHQNVTVAEAIVLSCFPPRSRIVYEEGNFPSVRYLYQSQPAADVHVVPEGE
jgi:kynureninase